MIDSAISGLPRPALAAAYSAAGKLFVTVGASGSDVSTDGGKTWMPIGTAPYNALSFAPDGAGWAVGPNGAIAAFVSAR